MEKKRVVISSPEGFSSSIWERRVDLDVTQGQVARAARISRVYVTQLESGTRPIPSTKIVGELSHALGVEFEFTGNVKPSLRSRDSIEYTSEFSTQLEQMEERIMKELASIRQQLHELGKKN